MPTFDRRFEHLAEQRRSIDRIDAGLHDLFEPALDLVVVEHFERAAQHVGHRSCGSFGVSVVGKPRAGPLADLRPTQPLVDHLRGQEVRLDEVAQAPADVVLALADDRRVRDRDTERMAEQGGHREPVGERADHCRLGDSAYVADPRSGVLVELRNDEDHRGDDQQRRGHRLHTTEVASASGVAGSVDHGRFRGPGDRGRHRPDGNGERYTRRFESLPEAASMERCQSGRMGCPAKALTLRGPWVQIPPSPPSNDRCARWGPPVVLVFDLVVTLLRH